MDLGILAGELGFDALWVADHLMLGRDESIMEGWTTLSALAGATQGTRLGIIHQGHYMRPPAMTAKMVATLDQISGGRSIFFYDFGRQPREHSAYGFSYPDLVDDRVEQMLAGLDLIRALWTSTDPISGTFGNWQLHNAVLLPKPLQQPHPPIWFGEIEPGLLDACARFGHGWNSAPCDLKTFVSRVAMLRAACVVADRNPADIEISLEMQMLIGTPTDIRKSLQKMLEAAGDIPVDPDIHAWLGGGPVPDWFRQQTLIGEPDEISAQIESYQRAGVDHLMLWFLDAPDDAGIRQFATEIAPRFTQSI